MQDGQTTRAVNRLVHCAQNFTIEVRRCNVCQVFGHRLTSNR